MPKKNHRTLSEKLYDANILSDGALINIPYEDIINAKIKKDSKFYRKKSNS